MAKAKNAIPQGLHSVTPHLVFDKAAEAIEWYKRGLGAEEVSRAVGPDGKIMHAQIRIGNSPLFLNDEMGGGKSLKTIGGSPIGLWIYTEDADALYHKALRAGATVAPGPMGELQDQFWGDRCGTVIDPAGYHWTIATHKEDLTGEEIDHRMQEAMKQMQAAKA